MSELQPSFDFGAIIRELKEQPKVYAYRKGWNGIIAGKDMRLTLETPYLEDGDDFIDAAPCFVLTTEGVSVIGWLASQTDMLAEDWVIKNV